MEKGWGLMDIRKLVAVAFVDAVNTQDFEAMQTLFVGVCPNKGIERLTEFRISVERILVDGDLVVMIGEARKDEERIPATWTAQIFGCKVVDWQVYYAGLHGSEN
jgi:stress response protein SCP2